MKDKMKKLFLILAGIFCIFAGLFFSAKFVLNLADSFAADGDCGFLSINRILILKAVIVSIGIFLLFVNKLITPLSRGCDAFLHIILKIIRRTLTLNTTNLLILFFIINITLRLILQMHQSILDITHDGADYMNLAKSILDGTPFKSKSLWMVFLQPEKIPYPDAHRGPLFSLLVYISYVLFGINLFSARFVSIVVGSLIPIINYHLCFKLTKSKNISFLTLILTSFHSSLFMDSFAIHAESCLIFFVLITFLFLLNNESKKQDIFVGFFLALSWMTKSQGILIFPAILIYIFLHNNTWLALRKISVVIIVFILTASPWLIRNFIEFGNAFYSDLQYNLISTYAKFHSEDFYMKAVEIPPNNYLYILTHPTEVLHHFFKAIFNWETAGLLFAPLEMSMAFIGFLISLKESKTFLFIYIYILTMFVAFNLTVHSSRYFLSAIPFLIILSSIAYVYLLEMKYNNQTQKLDKKITSFALPLFLIFGFIPTILNKLQYKLLRISAYTFYGVSISFILCFILFMYWFYKKSTTNSLLSTYWIKYFFVIVFCFVIGIHLVTGITGIYHSENPDKKNILYNMSVADFITQHTNPFETIMVGYTPYFMTYLTNRNTISFPLTNEKKIQCILKKYNVKYIALPKYELEKYRPSWLLRTPKNIGLVNSIQKTSMNIYEVKYFLEDSECI